MRAAWAPKFAQFCVVGYHFFLVCSQVCTAVHANRCCRYGVEPAWQGPAVLSAAAVGALCALQLEWWSDAIVAPSLALLQVAVGPAAAHAAAVVDCLLCCVLLSYMFHCTHRFQFVPTVLVVHCWPCVRMHALCRAGAGSVCELHDSVVA